MIRARGVCLLPLVTLAFLLVSCAASVEHLPTPTSLALAPSRPTPAPVNITPQPALLEKRQLVLEWPKTILEKESDWVILSILMDESGRLTATAEGPGHTTDGTPIQVPDVYKTHNIVAVARLDLAGMEVYREEIRQPLASGQPANFRWSIRAGDAGTYKGVVWLRLELVPKAGGAVDDMLLLARPIEIQSVTVLGLPGAAARLLGGLGLLLSAVLGYPLVQKWLDPWLNGWLKRRKAPQVAQPDQPADKEVAKGTD